MFGLHRSGMLVLLLAALVLGGSVTPVGTRAAPQAEQSVVARITTRDRAEVERLAGMGLDLLEFRRGDDLFVITTPTEIEHLRMDGWQIAVDDEQTALLRRDEASVSGVGSSSFNGGYRSAAEIEATLRDRAARYGHIAEMVEYGRSYLGAPLLAIKLTNRQRATPKPTLFIVSAVHSREITTPEVALRFVDELLSRYGADADVTSLLDEQQVVIVPLANPDGYRWVEQGYYQRKNGQRYGTGCADPPQYQNQYGVDLNRNSSWAWGTVIGPGIGGCSVLYPGPSVASAPETVAIENFVRSLIPDQRGPGIGDAAPLNTSGIFLTLHSYGNLVIWPWAYTASPAPNSADLARIGGKLASYNGYGAIQANAMYPMSGTTDDWSYGALGIPSYTFEIGLESGTCGGFMPPYSCMDSGAGGSFWAKNKPALIYAARIARTPYLLARGPAPESASATGQTITAVLDDIHNGGQGIVAAEYYVDTPPWRGGTGTPLRPADGAWGSTRETVTGTANVPWGRHTVYVRGQDSAGYWGPVQVVWVAGPAAPHQVWVPLATR